MEGFRWPNNAEIPKPRSRLEAARSARLLQEGFLKTWCGPQSPRVCKQTCWMSISPSVRAFKVERSFLGGWTAHIVRVWQQSTKHLLCSVLAAEWRKIPTEACYVYLCQFYVGKIGYEAVSSHDQCKPACAIAVSEVEGTRQRHLYALYSQAHTQYTIFMCSFDKPLGAAWT